MYMFQSVCHLRIFLSVYVLKPPILIIFAIPACLFCLLACEQECQASRVELYGGKRKAPYARVVFPTQEIALNALLKMNSADRTFKSDVIGASFRIRAAFFSAVGN